MKKIHTILPAIAILFAFASSGKAQTLETYFNLQGYGTVSSGSSITDTTGTTSAILNSPNTSLTSGGLAITAAGAADSTTGLTLGSGSLSTYGTGAFTIEDWFTPTISTTGTSWAGLWGGSSVNNTSGTFLFSNLWGEAISTSGGGIQLNPSTNLNSVNTLYDSVITYDGAGTLKQYTNGILVGTKVIPAGTFLTGGLSAVTNFAIGGVADSAFPGDTTQTTTTSDFLMFNGALTTSQITTLDGFGPGATLADISGAGIGIASVPEPSTWAMLLGGMGLLVLVARRRSIA